MEILYEDQALFVVHKEAGMAVESARVTERDLVSALRGQQDGKEVYLVHRLDQPVEGLVVVAKTREAAGLLSAEIRDGKMKKYYVARVSGSIPEEEGTLTDYLLRDGKSNLSKVVPKPQRRTSNGPKKAVLHYKKKAEQLLEIELLTGRHHQIRAQLSHAGMPILGDRKYGGEVCPALRRGAIALCAVRLEFTHPTTGELMKWEVTPSFLSEVAFAR